MFKNLMIGMVLIFLWTSTLKADDTLPSGGKLFPGHSKTSNNDKFTFIYQGDGNLVLYHRGGCALWSTSTHGQASTDCVMQDDGNLVIYNNGHAVWATGTHGNGPSRLVVQDDGNVVIYRQSDGKATWSTDTHGIDDNLEVNEGMSSDIRGKRISNNGDYRLIYQGDGNLVLYYKCGHPLWSTGTHGQPSTVCVMQNDGNLVIYNNGHAVWATGTHGNGPSRLAVQDDGNVVIYRQSDGKATWATGTNGKTCEHNNQGTIFPIINERHTELGDHRRMKTKVQISKNGRLDMWTDTWTDKQFEGFTGAVQIFLLDKDNNILHATNEYSYGVNGKQVPGPSSRSDHQDEQIPSDVLQEVRKMAIKHRVNAKGIRWDVIKGHAEKLREVYDEVKPIIDELRK